MNYQNLYVELDRNIYYGNRYMLNKLKVRIKSLLNDVNIEIREFAQENIEELNKLKEPYDLKTGELIHYSDQDKIIRITEELLAILREKKL